jgi:Family of unknown function (DUF5681)
MVQSIMMKTETAEEQQNPWLFKPGQSGNPAGRPKGSRNRHTENFLRAMSDDFERHGPEVIAKVRTEKLHIWLKIAADLLPRNVELDVNIDALNATEALQAYRGIQRAVPYRSRAPGRAP